VIEPRPWQEDGATEIEKALLRAGRAESPRKGTDLRILASIQASTQGLSAPPVKPAAAARWVKIGLVAVVAGGVALMTYQLSRTRVPPQTMSSETVTASAVPRLGKESESAGDGEPTPQTFEENARGRRAVAIARRPQAPQRQSDDHSLGEETKALDQARKALAAHQPSEVLQLLDEYRRRFPNGRLRPEATILRLAALVEAGDREAADSLARRLLSDEAYASYEPRIRSLLREGKQ